MNSEPAIIPAIILSDGVIREQGTNKLSCIGIFNVFNLPALPFRLPPFFATAAITNLRGIIGELNAACRFEAHTGHVLASSNAKIQFSKESPPMQPAAIIEISFPMRDIVITAPGTYQLKLLVNGEEIGQRSVEVRSLVNKQEKPPQ
jgi:hypothetical protein